MIKLSQLILLLLVLTSSIAISSCTQDEEKTVFEDIEDSKRRADSIANLEKNEDSIDEGGDTDTDTNTGNSFVLKGNLMDADASHKASGKVTFIKDGAKFTLTFEGVDITPGPDLDVYLSSNLGIEGSVKVGKLKGTDGNFEYDLSNDIDINAKPNVIIWCTQVGVLFGHTTLE